jgi:hypothetical protein
VELDVSSAHQIERCGSVSFRIEDLPTPKLPDLASLDDTEELPVPPGNHAEGHGYGLTLPGSSLREGCMAKRVPRRRAGMEMTEAS